MGHYQQQIIIVREISDRQVEGDALGNMGNVLAFLGNFTEAISCHQSTMEIYHQIGNHRCEAISTFNLAIALVETGDSPLAIEYMRTALTTCKKLHDPNAALIETQLDEWLKQT